MDKIDFVIIWVDGNDPEWQAEKAKYSSEDFVESAKSFRYRDWDNLQYWFRGVEKFAPWVNKVHFVTWGHLPTWLNTNHPKLNIVNHKAYIPEKYLPTFSANPIELNLHRIKDLSENFVFFNDDMFIIEKVNPQDFFKNGLPCDTAALNVHCNDQRIIQNIAFNDVGVINCHFDMNKTLKQDFFKWFNFKYRSLLLRTLPLVFCPRFPGFYQPHLPASYTKSTFETLWKLEHETLDNTCKHKFRNASDVNQWLMREWQLASNDFIPRSVNFGKALQLKRDCKYEEAHDFVCKQKAKMVCINDGEMDNEEFEKAKGIINSAFEKILPDKSEFEL